MITEDQRSRIQIGDVVQYEDMANPPTRYLVLSDEGEFREYEIRNIITGRRTTSDLLQQGWSVVYQGRQS